ncbi:DUF6173 family protein [Pseudooceanicola sp. HF7]|uniref:DUF6173 family protein n=1 Tax=Pseudooceanicola sp. HF7 TaxID=2721560 RepID=UPI00143046D7|nr:DUF6173 family protein [Pseudooceanicola sp. HF7]NIZ08303.1 hypothetical protein [Pseudooceanicola sp. HF7]
MDNKVETSAEHAENAVLPCRHEVRTDCDTPEPPKPEQVIDRPVSTKSAAAWAYERLILYIQDFEEKLDPEQEAVMGFAGGGAGVLRIEGMGYFDPDIVTFTGTDTEGRKTQLIQHVSQLSVMLRAMPKASPAEAPRRIGFRLRTDLERSQV